MHFTLNRDALAYVPAKLKLFVSTFIILSETRSAMAGREFGYQDPKVLCGPPQLLWWIRFWNRDRVKELTT